jgi:DNA-binding transcriptional LysR family regulator
MIDRYRLRYFLAVVDHGNFSRAAAHCNVAQPTLSVGIAKLERAVGTPLFVRSNQRVELTGAGSRLLAHARRIESEFNQAQRIATDSAEQEDVLRVGVLRSVPAGLIAGGIAAARGAVATGAPLEIVEGSEREISGHLARERIDIAVTLVGRGADRFLEESLLEEGYCLALPADHPHATAQAVQAEALADNVMIVRRHCEALSETSRHFTERGVRPRFAYRATDDERVLAMVAAGLAVTVIPQSLARPGIACPLLAGFTPRRTIGLMFGQGREGLRDAPPAFITALRTEAPRWRRPSAQG